MNCRTCWRPRRRLLPFLVLTLIAATAACASGATAIKPAPQVSKIPPLATASAKVVAFKANAVAVLRCTGGLETFKLNADGSTSPARIYNLVVLDQPSRKGSGCQAGFTLQPNVAAVVVRLATNPPAAAKVTNNNSNEGPRLTTGTNPLDQEVLLFLDDPDRSDGFILRYRSGRLLENSPLPWGLISA